MKKGTQEGGREERGKEGEGGRREIKIKGDSEGGRKEGGTPIHRSL